MSLPIRRPSSWFSVLIATFMPAVACAQPQEPQEQFCSNKVLSRPISLHDAVAAALGNQPKIIIAQQEVEKARANLTAALTPLLPNATLSAQNEHFVPSSNAATPVIGVGSIVVGGQQEAYVSYRALGINWNLFNGGRDMAGYRGANAGIRASEASLDSQVNDALTGILSAYGDLYKAQLAIRQQDRVLHLLKSTYVHASERLRSGTGTTLAIGRARNAVLDAERTLYQVCHTLADKSAVLAQAMGMRLPAGQLFQVVDIPLTRSTAIKPPIDLDAILQNDPAVIAAKEKVAVAETKMDQARGAYAPTIALTGRRDFLSQNPKGFGAASYNGYRVGVVLQQPLGPFTAEYAGVDAARADLKKAQATYEQALIDAETQLRKTLSAWAEAEASAGSAQASFAQAQEILALTESQFNAGRTDADNVERAQIDYEKARRQAQELLSDLGVATWLVDRVLDPKAFPLHLVLELGIQDGGFKR